MSRALLLALGLAVLVPGRALLLARGLLAPLPGAADTLLVQACVRSIPQLAESGWRFDARVQFPRHAGWPARQLRMQLPATMPGPLVGECWQYAARLSQPQDAAGRRALLREHLSGYARVEPGPLNQRLAAVGNGLTALRGRLARRVADQVQDPSAAALLAALAVGATGEVSTRQWQVFNATGITHLVAISGLHVTFLALLAMLAARRAWRWCAPRRWLPRRSLFAALVGVACALLYAQLAGFAVPAQRTVVMLAALLAMRECARCMRPAWSVAVALLAVLLYDPLAALAAGFWLSFGAVAALLLLAGARLQAAAPAPAAVGLQWLVGMALLPLTVAIFGAFSAAGMLVNLLAIPVFTVLLVPPVLIASVCLLLPGNVVAYCGGLLLQLAGAVATALWPGLCWFADLPGSLWHARPALSWYLLAMPVVVLVLLPVAWRRRLAALALLMSVFLLQAPRPATGTLWIDAQGQGGAATMLLRTRTHLLLLGSGEVYGGAGRRFARQVLPRLRAAGYSRLDLWLPGNLTRDTQAALHQAVAVLPVARVVLAPTRAAPPELHGCSAAHWRWDDIEFELRASDDGRECVLAATAGGQRVEFDKAGAVRGTLGADGRAQLMFSAGGLARRSPLLRL